MQLVYIMRYMSFSWYKWGKGTLLNCPFKKSLFYWFHLLNDVKYDFILTYSFKIFFKTLKSNIFFIGFSSLKFNEKQNVYGFKQYLYINFLIDLSSTKIPKYKYLMHGDLTLFTTLFAPWRLAPSTLWKLVWKLKLQIEGTNFYGF